MITKTGTVLTLTVRELVKEQREAFETGVQWATSLTEAPSAESAKRTAPKFFPLPKITRPRVVPDRDGYVWRVVSRGDIEWAIATGEGEPWRRLIQPGQMTHTPTIERLRIWLDLLEHPNEEVEDDAC